MQQVNITSGQELKFDDSLFVPIKTKSLVDSILSHEGGLMPATNMVVAGGPGSGKSTLTLDLLSKMQAQGHKVLFVSAEMDQIAHFKYCKRLPQIAKVPVLFMKDHFDEIKEVMEYVFKQGWDVIAIDSFAEVVNAYKDAYKATESQAEKWFLGLQDAMKKGLNDESKYTAFMNIQQTTKAGVFAGSNRLKHMVDAMAHITVQSGDREIIFSKNRDGETDQPVYFKISRMGIDYSLEFVPETEE